jgi:hypothetical protein
VKVWLGYAADERGRGVALVRIRRDRKDEILRLAFRVTGAGESGYAALAVALPLVRKRAERVVLEISDEELVAELTRQREIPPPFVMPYVRTRCALNAFTSWILRTGEGARDLDARAIAELTLAA